MVGPALLRLYKNLDGAMFRSSYEDALYRELKKLVSLDQAMTFLPATDNCYFGVWRDAGSARWEGPTIAGPDYSVLSAVGRGGFRLSAGSWSAVGQENMPDFEYSNSDTVRLHCSLKNCPNKAD